MNRPEFRIPEEKTQEVFTLAAQLYAKHNQSYTVTELMEAGAEAKIPPEFIQQAIDQLQIEHSPAQSPATKRSKALVGLAIGLPLLAAIATAGWLIARNAATTAQTGGLNTAPPISDSAPIGGANPVAGEFKCAGANLARQNLTGKIIKDCTGANLAGANLSRVDAESGNLSRANLSNAKLNDANLKGTDLAGANLSGADLSGADLEGANLTNTNLKGANLKNANITRTDLAGANTDGANLNDAQK
ncbi:MAG TPA: hypothetical protein DCE56_42450 [Cyanobacteria bacterium UBA8553]|nr:hypothetical protein [Cyanobacteria bacterium UBA8553]HAJ60845.1 hypothetical protein [Cyanobacteria bacterium UBA8543]